MSDGGSQGGRLEAVTGDNWREFIGSDRAVLVLGKSDCGNCATWSAELGEWLASDEDWKDVRFGKMTLDTGASPSSRKRTGGSPRSTCSPPTSSTRPASG